MTDSAIKIHAFKLSQIKCQSTHLCTYIIKTKTEISKRYLESRESASVIRKRGKTEYENIDEPLFEWFTAARSKNNPISGPLLQEKALDIAKMLCMDQLRASNGWLRCFRKRYGISFKVPVNENELSYVYAKKDIIKHDRCDKVSDLTKSINVLDAIMFLN